MTEEQKKVMRTQDIKYVEMKRVAEAKVSLKFPVLHHPLKTHFVLVINIDSGISAGAAKATKTFLKWHPVCL